MTALRRILALGTIAILTVACGAKLTPAPGATETAIPSRQVQTEAPIELPSPTPGCLPIEETGATVPEIALSWRYGGWRITPTITVARDLSGRPVSLPDPGELSPQDLGHMPGGVAVTGSLLADDESRTAPPGAVVTASLTLRGESAPTTMTLRQRGSTVTLTLPDVDAQARLDVRLVFADACYRYEAKASASMTIGSTRTVAACPGDDDARTAYLNRLLDQPILVDGRKIEPTLSGGEWLWPQGDFATDYGTLFPGWDRDAAAVTGSPGSTVDVRALSDDYVLTGFGTAFYLRSDALREFEPGVELRPIVTREPKAEPEGTFRLQLPQKVGRYVTVSNDQWKTPCLAGGSIASFSVDVK